MRNAGDIQSLHDFGSFKRVLHVRDGVRLVTIDEGPRASSSEPLLLLHGWACDSWTLAAQVAHFRKDRRVLVPDLRGHGDSDAPDQAYDVGAFVDDIQWQLDEWEVEHAVVIGHSMGGIIGLELAARLPARVSGTLMIDSALLPPAAMSAGLQGLSATLQTLGLTAALEEAASLVFTSDDSKHIRANILKAMAATPHHVAVSSFRGHLLDYSAATALSACQVPLGYVAAATIVADLIAARALFPGLMTAQTLGSGHFSPVFVPEQINPIIERFIELVGTAPS